MSDNTDKLNYIKNMIWMMCCDGDIADREKRFLATTAREIGAQIDDWNTLMKQVVADKGKFYPISDFKKAVATLKSLVIMAKADKKLDTAEKKHLLKFAKSLGLTNQQFKSITKDIDISTHLDPFKEPHLITGNFIAIEDDFEKIEDFKKVARQNNIETMTTAFDEFISAKKPDQHIVCFHAAEDKNKSIERCEKLIDKAGQNIAAILTRYQGHQVKYLHEKGLKKCIIEPVYEHDIKKLVMKRD